MAGGKHDFCRSGFTLPEMAVAVTIVGLVVLTVFPALTAMRSGSQRSMTQANLQSLMQATAAYVQANGCLPCPTPASATGAGFGRVRGDSSAAPAACGTCTTAEGIPPYMSLGLAANVAHDGGGHWISMRVDPALTANFAVVPPTKPVACTCAAPVGGTCAPSPANCTCSPPVNGACTPLPAGLSQQGLCASGLAATNRINVRTPYPAQPGVPQTATQQAAVIFVSHGVKGHGSFFANPSPGLNNGFRLPFPPALYPVQTCSSTASFAICNADNNTDYVDAPAVISKTDPYDNMLAFADRNMLVSMLGGGACQTAW